MKNFLLTIFLVMFGLFTIAQTRISLYEEFTGEDCIPCAIQNPGFDALLAQPLNSSKMVAIKWVQNFYIQPYNWGPYMTNKTENDWRYRPANLGGYGYALNGVPNSQIDGQVATIFGALSNQPAALNNTVINTASSFTTPFSLSINPLWNASYSNALVTVTIQSSQTFTANGPLIFRLVLVERKIVYPSSPGSNGETNYENVARKSYPTLQTGTSLPTSWIAGQTQTFTINCPTPSYINDFTQMAFVGFIQDDSNKKIWQTCRTLSIGTLPNDAYATGSYVHTSTCPNSINPEIVVFNQGNNAITTMTIIPSIDGVLQAPVTWLGNLAINTSTIIPINSYNIIAGSHVVQLNITGVNNGDVNTPNNLVSNNFVFTTNTYITEAFTTSYFSSYYYYWSVNNLGSDTLTWFWNSTVGFSGAGAIENNFFNNFIVGDVDELQLPVADLTGATSPLLSFDVSYAQRSNQNDKLEVKTSIDCGITWTTIYNKSGAILSTAPPTTAEFFPTASQWRHEVVALPSNTSNHSSVMVKFVGTSDNGNNLYIDNVNLGQTITSINTLKNNVSSIELFPNPANEETNISITTNSADKTKITVVNMLGQQVFNKEVEFPIGANNYKLNTKEFATGIYNVIIESNSGTSVKKLSIVK